MITPIWMNKKNKNKYLVLGTARNCTNAQDGQVMIRYANLGSLSDVLVREQVEFELKFDPVSYP